MLNPTFLRQVLRFKTIKKADWGNSCLCFPSRHTLHPAPRQRRVAVRLVFRLLVLIYHGSPLTSESKDYFFGPNDHPRNGLVLRWPPGEISVISMKGEERLYRRKKVLGVFDLRRSQKPSLRPLEDHDLHGHGNVELAQFVQHDGLGLFLVEATGTGPDQWKGD